MTQLPSIPGSIPEQLSRTTLAQLPEQPWLTFRVIPPSNSRAAPPRHPCPTPEQLWINSPATSEHFPPYFRATPKQPLIISRATLAQLSSNSHPEQLFRATLAQLPINPGVPPKRPPRAPPEQLPRATSDQLPSNPGSTFGQLPSNSLESLPSHPGSTLEQP